MRSSAEVSDSDVSFTVSVSPETEEFVVKDVHNYMMDVFELDGDHLKRVLEEMAHFSVGMGLTHALPPEYKYKCCLMQSECLSLSLSLCVCVCVCACVRACAYMCVCACVCVLVCMPRWVLVHVCICSM